MKTMTMMTENDREFRLQRFWGITIFSLGVFWGFANLVYFPVAALTSFIGSTWFEVSVIAAGGMLSCLGSIGAWRNRRVASWWMLVGGLVLLGLAIAGRTTLAENTRGVLNLLLLFLAGAVAASLGIFGILTEQKRWPRLR